MIRSDLARSDPLAPGTAAAISWFRTVLGPLCMAAPPQLVVCRTGSSTAGPQRLGSPAHLQAVGLGTLASAPFSLMTVADLLRLCSCSQQQRLRRFLDLQLRLYSQEPCERTQRSMGPPCCKWCKPPWGWHLQGSMQVLSEQLAAAVRVMGTIQLRQRVTQLERCDADGWRVHSQHPDGRRQAYLQRVDPLVFRPSACQRAPAPMPGGIQAADQQVESTERCTGALRRGDRDCLPADCPAHLQRDGQDPTAPCSCPSAGMEMVVPRKVKPP